MSAQPARHSPSILVALALCMALQMTGFVMILLLFARRFESFGAGVAALGLSELAYALTAMVAAPFMGLLADRLGRRPIVLLSLAAYVLAFSAHILDIAPSEQTARIMGLKAAAGSLGNMLGPALVVLSASLVSPQAIFLGASGLIILLVLTSAFGLRRPERDEAVHQISDAAAAR